MFINDRMKELGMTMYKLSKESGIPQTTINDICNGRTDIDKCSAETLYKISKALDVTVEDILEIDKPLQRCDFETFKGNVCHYVKDKGDMEFIVEVLQKDEIRRLYRRQWYIESMYLLGMLDYISRVNNVPICTKYDDIRSQKLEKPVFPSGVLVTSEVLDSDEPLKKAEKEAIPEFKRFNIIESEVRNVI